MIVRLVGLHFVLCLVTFGTKAEVTVRNNAYYNLLVSFSPNLSVENGKLLLDSMQALVENTSQVLHQATGVHIASAIFHFPATWDTSSWDTLNVKPASTDQTLNSADIRVDATSDSTFGKYPFALQFGGCGIPGQQISVPANFLDQEEDYPKGKLLAREWLKYRYGVFDENGFPDDPMYPAHYRIPGSSDIRITECTHPEVEYFFKDANGDNCSMGAPGASSARCLIYPERESADSVVSSLMNFHRELTNVDQLCGKDNSHNDVSPSKHNTLCGYKSIWDVLKISPDFESAEPASEYKTPQFSYVQEYYPRVSAVWENSGKLFERRNIVPFAVWRLLYDLPEQSKCALYHFAKDLEQVRNLAPVGARDADISSGFVYEGEVCVTCALSKAIEDLKTDSVDQQGSIIMIVGSNGKEDVTELAENLRDSRLCLTIVAFVEEGAALDGFEPLISASSCNSILQIQTIEDDLVAFNKLYQAMQSAVPQVQLDRIKTVNSGVMSFNDGIDIPADSTADSYTIWFPIPVPPDTFQCTKGDGADVGLTKMPGKNNVASYSFGAQNSAVECKRISDRLGPVLTQVQMTTKPGEYFVENVWFHDFTQESDTNQMPIIIYANIHFGAYPVGGALVTASVTDPIGNVERFALNDNGRGDPDITWNDGIYSGYYTEFSDAGNYTVTVTFHDDHTNSRMGRNGADRCCGSNVMSDTQTVPSFQRTFHTSFEAKGGRPEMGYKPSRILDLRVDPFDPPNSITLKWTAPGGQMDKGRAKSYTIKTFPSRGEATCNFENSGTDINVTFIPSVHGIPEILAIDLDDYFEDNSTYYLSMRSNSDNGLVSDVSTVLEFFVPEDTRMTTGADETSTDVAEITDPKQSGTDKKTIGIVIGVVVAVIVLVACVYLAVYVFVRRSRLRAEDDETTKPNNESARNNSERSNAGIGLNSIPADVILKHHNEVVNAKSLHKDPPIFTEENLDSAASTPNLSLNPGAQYTLVQKRGADGKETQENPPKSPKRMTFV